MLSTFFLTAALYSLRASATTTCKCLPGDDCYPTTDEWSSFESSLEGDLIAQVPCASVCYTATADYSTAACEVATTDQYNTTVIASESNAIMWTTFEALINGSTVESCTFSDVSNGTCQQGRVPVYSVNATSVADIQTTLSFASEYNLRLVVKNTGHELLGRAFGYGALELFTHYFKSIEFFDDFVPENAPSGTEGQYAITIGPGVQWGDVYTAAYENNRTVAGGFVPFGTVGAGGGWPLGGGHSPLSPSYGLGVDNVLQFSIVLPNGTDTIANAYTNTDLFWALRGGAGPSFGIIHATTYKTHPNPPYTGAFYEAAAESTEAFTELLTLWNQYHNSISDAGWGGAWPFEDDVLFLTLIAPGYPVYNESANTTLQAFFDASAEIDGVTVAIAETVGYDSFYDWYYDNLVVGSSSYGIDYTDETLGGIGIAISSWLPPRELFDEYPSELATIFANFSVIATPFMVGGATVYAVDEDAMAVNPVFRRTSSDIYIQASLDADATAEEIQAARQSVYDQITPLRELAPVPYGGQYVNEPDYLEDDWQTAFWGANYDRLLSIKQEIDPDDLLIVFKGVGSEDWDDEITCKTT